MLKDLLSESAKQFEEFTIAKPWELRRDAFYVDASPDAILKFCSSRISSAYALGEQSGIKKAVDNMKIEGEMGKLTPFQQTVNTYIENRGKEIITLQSKLTTIQARENMK